MFKYDPKHVYQTGETNEDLVAKYNPDGSQRREIQLRMLGMLNYIVDACNVLGIDYYLDGGTLLGAVRHGGFIPWDDDMDIVIDVKDIKRLEKYLLAHPDPKYFLQNRKTDKGYYNGWCKLRDRYSSSVYVGESLEVSNQQKTIQNTGVAIDIFQYSDHVITWMNKIIHGFHRRVTLRYLVGKKTLLANFLSGVTYHILCPIANTLGLIFSNKKTIAHDYCSCNTVHRFMKDKVYPLSTIEFENRRYKAPKDVDYYLRTLYDNYWCLPPEEERHHHDLIYTLTPIHE